MMPGSDDVNSQLGDDSQVSRDGDDDERAKPVDKPVAHPTGERQAAENQDNDPPA